MNASPYIRDVRDVFLYKEYLKRKEKKGKKGTREKSIPNIPKSSPNCVGYIELWILLCLTRSQAAEKRIVSLNTRQILVCKNIRPNIIYIYDEASGLDEEA